MKIAIAGLGSIGRRHLKNLLALGEKDIILYRSGKGTLSSQIPSPLVGDLPAGQAGGQGEGGLPVVSSIEVLLEHKPDAIIISNPTALHLDVAIPAAKAGCHLLLEKPVSHSMERIGELKSAAKHGGGKIIIGFQFRFHPTLKTAAKLLADGEIGQVVSLRSHWGEYLPGWHPWEDYKKGYAARKELGGGVVLTLCHPFDYLNWLVGRSELAWAHTDTKGGLGIEVEDVADVVLRLPGGAFGSVHLNYLQRPTVHTLEIVGTKGTLFWNGSDGQLTLCKYDSETPKTFAPPEGFERNSMFLEEMHHFLSVARGEVAPVCTLDDGIYALEIALLSLRGTK